jgi:hypothetical protein
LARLGRVPTVAGSVVRTGCGRLAAQSPCEFLRRSEDPRDPASAFIREAVLVERGSGAFSLSRGIRNVPAPQVPTPSRARDDLLGKRRPDSASGNESYRTLRTAKVPEHEPSASAGKNRAAARENPYARCLNRRRASATRPVPSSSNDAGSGTGTTFSLGTTSGPLVPYREKSVGAGANPESIQDEDVLGL